MKTSQQAGEIANSHSGLQRFDLTGRVSFITGGYGHLGKAMTLALASAHSTVYVACRHREKFMAAFEDSQGSNIKFVQCDISDESSVQSAFKSVFEQEGRLDTIVNNAMYTRMAMPEDTSSEAWNIGIDGTLSSVFRCIKEAVPYLKKSPSANIINIGSMYGVVSPDFRIYEGSEHSFNPISYGVSKAGIIQMTRYYAVYLAKYGIRVNCISPGGFPSGKVQKDAGFIERLSQRIPMQRIGRPEELGGCVIFLASEASSYATGQNFVIDGGLTAW